MFVEGLVGPGDGELVLDDAGAGGGEHLADLGLRPDGAELARGRANDRRGLALQRGLARGRETQSIAFLSAPGMDELYSGVAKRIPSASATAWRSSATDSGAGMTSSSSS